MKLKRVKFFGFKTFADKIELDLDGDFIAVVGPNGCGKSNIVDAIMWGLGEPNARNLRANTSQEVIFSGSAKRKPLSYAEVSLFFDNSDGKLMLDAPEVEISRRLNRNGDSEYLINKKSCRQKDIFDLLADSGLGRTGYSIVGQKDIDAALSASADERRAWIDEAAGVQRYRLKRQESLRRLHAANLSLTRVQDILTEIETQREPLKAQAEVARRYREALTALREIEVGLLAQEFAKAAELLENLDRQILSMTELAESQRVHLVELDKDSAKVSEEMTEAEMRLDSNRELQQSLLTAQTRLEGELKLAEQKLRSLDELELSLESEVATSAERHQDLQDEATRSETAYDSEREKLATLKQAVPTSESTAQLRSDLEEVESKLSLAKAADRLLNQAEAQEKLQKVRITQLRREVKGIEESMPDLEAGVKEAEELLQAEREKTSSTDAALKDLRGERRELELRLKGIETDRRIALSKRADLGGRKQGIEATIHANEGVSQGSRAVLAAQENGLLERSYTLVADAIVVEADLLVAIETALGASGNDLIVPSEREAKAAIEFLKGNRLGRATFQPVTLMRNYSVSADLHRLRNERGVVGIAAELVTAKSGCGPVIDSLLGRILVLETLDYALRLARTTGWSRLVTLDGEVLHSSGAVTGGVQQKSNHGLVTKRQELVQLESELARLDSEVTRLDSEGQKVLARIDALDSNELGLMAQIEAYLPDREDAERWLASLRAELNEAVKSRQRLQNELSSLGAVPEEIDRNLIAQLPELEAKRTELIGIIAAQDSGLDQAVKQIAEAEERVAAARARYEQAGSRLSILGATAGGMEAKRQRIAKERIELKQLQADSEIQQAKGVQRLSDVAIQLAELQSKRAGLLEHAFKLSEETKGIRDSISRAETTARQAEMEKSRHDARKAQAYQRLLDEYGIGEAEAVEIAQTTLVPDDARTVVTKLRSEIRAMGDVNVGAIELYDQLTERHDALQAQFDDVIEGKKEVEAGIRELDQMTRGKFLETFDELKIHFREYFSLLFEGGDAELSLSDPENTLESGVEIEVTIPGKKRQRLELLSGGERAMSACAFLFSLLKCKPSPLVILDEVDAPLDGRNVERFLNALKTFRGITQFILITHNNLTIESAPMWLGVTMQEPGVTSIIPFRAQFAEEHAVAFMG